MIVSLNYVTKECRHRPPAFPKINKFTPKQRSEASEAQSKAAKEASFRSKARMKSRLSSARVEFDTERERKLKV